MDECPSGLRSTPRKRVRVTSSASSNLASSASRVSSKSLEALFSCRKISNLYFIWCSPVVRLYRISVFFDTNALHEASFFPSLYVFWVKFGTKCGRFYGVCFSTH